MIKDLIQRMFAARNAAHLEHWKTNSYAQHKALGGYYDVVIDKLDDLIEAYQGSFGLVNLSETDNIIKLINDELLWLNENREAICKGVPALENILDDLTALHMTTLYKLENLK
jgi:hypothetical protein